MKRVSWLLFAIAPVAMISLYAFAPAQSEADQARSTAERARHERDAAEDLIAKLPPGLAAPDKKELAHELVATAMNSTKKWRSLYGHIADSGHGSGYCGGVVGFCSGTKDMLTLVESYTEDHPDNGLAEYLPALREVNGTDSHKGLDGFTEAWEQEADQAAFRAAQDELRDSMYFKEAVDLAKMDGLGTLGQFIYYDAMVLHGPGVGRDGFYGIRERAMAKAKTKAEGGKETVYLNAFLDTCRQVMKQSDSGRDTSRIDTAQRVFLREGNLDLRTPLTWHMYGEEFRSR
ncbi:chitosanase [Streptomyces sp. ISL-96]|uniref:chitosanase n=1 Tax=Streptomyces sp. ISL-96 TaxID=2819191 RepID=UPI001BE5A4EC|nr:chitosanase [Streptomyces sp. ISL-96]MBT2491208.1 chitosanase [Streptomyces sp. ISL-96]